jgi:hypothetical protein
MESSPQWIKDLLVFYSRWNFPSSYVVAFSLKLSGNPENDPFGVDLYYVLWLVPLDPVAFLPRSCRTRNCIVQLDRTEREVG